ncbi:MAG: Tripartite-type tricarboxylate transporter, receptor component TctC [Rhodoferax sp.]|nr:Tripartite-type tricarboxylate transporter, receptor component TctC [Rhodoferax sp.]
MIKTSRNFLRLAVSCALVAAAGTGLVAQAQGNSSTAAYPDRPIRIIVPYPPGGTTDPVARLLAADIGPRLGQAVIVDNRAGAAGSIGTEAVVRSPADGYTLLLHTSAIATDPSFKKNLNYNVRKDLAPLMLAVTGAYMVVVNPSLPVKNVNELIAYAKANPGKLNYGSAGQGSSGHLIGELFKRSAGIDMIHVPYKGGGPSIAGLVGNEVQVLFDTVNSSGPLVKDGKLRAIAITSPQRLATWPDLPAVNESDVKNFSVLFWIGLFAPARTPAPIIDKLYAALHATLETPTFKERLVGMGMSADGRSPAEFGGVLDADILQWKSVIESARIEQQ